MRRSSLTLCLPPALLPTSAGPPGEEDSGAPSSSRGRGSRSEDELVDELRGLNLRPALHELDRGFSDTAAVAGRQAGAPPAAASQAAPRVSAGDGGGGAHMSARGGSVALQQHHHHHQQQQPPQAEVQRVGSRRPSTQPGGGGNTPAPVSSRGWPSSHETSACEGTRAASPAKAVAAAAPNSSSSSPQSSILGRRSRSTSPDRSFYDSEASSLVPAPAAAAPMPAAEDSGSSQWLSSLGSSVVVVPAVGGSPRSPARQPAAAAVPQPAAMQPDMAQTLTRPRGRAATASPASTRPSSRSSSRMSRGGGGAGYMVSTAAAEAKRGRPGSAGALSSRPSSAASNSRPGSASPTKYSARPRSMQHALEARVAPQMARDPAEWTVTEVCDWLDLIGLGQYRRRFVHNAVNGSLLLRLSNEELKAEIGVGPLGHREGLLTAINDLEQHWQQQRQQRAAEAAAAGSSSRGDWDTRGSPEGSPGSSRSGSPLPPGAHADYTLQKTFALRAKLVRELEKAEGRAAHRAKTVEQALRVVDQASEDIRKLQAAICQLDRQMGWQAATQQLFEPLDVHGAVPWQPAGKPRLRPGSAGLCSPSGRRSTSLSRGLSSSGGCSGSHAMSPVSRRIMEAQSAGGGGGSFLERLSKDIEARQAKSAEAARRAGRYLGGADAQQAEREREQRDIRFIREVVMEKNSDLAEMLDSGGPAQMAEAFDDMAESYQKEFELSDETVAAVKRLASPGKKAAKLASALRGAQFMQRLQQDLSTREARLQQLQQRYFKLEKGNSLEQQERADLEAAQDHFGLLGWSSVDLDVGPQDATANTDALLSALLKRAAALQEARMRDKPLPDWEQLEWRRDGLADKQRERNAQLQVALEEQQAAEKTAAAERASGGRKSVVEVVMKPKELPKPGDRLRETVELLAACRPAEVALLESLSGYRKLLMCWRAVRAQQFIAFTRRDLEARKAKAKALEAQVYPDRTKVLPKEEFEKFFDRLMEDTQRRAQHKEELAEKAKAEALAKLMKTAPQSLYHRRNRPASAPAS